MGQLDGKVALVTGGTRGIGLAIAKRLASEGAAIATVYSRSKEHADKAEVELKAFDVPVLVLQQDIGELDRLDALVKQVAEWGGGHIDILINSAARGLERPFETLHMRPGHMESTFRVNVLAPWKLVIAIAEYMPIGSSIINLTSLGTSRVLPRYSPVSTTKAALENLTVYLSEALGPLGIRINCISAGLVEETMGYDVFNRKEADMVAAFSGSIPLGRNVLPSDLAGAAFFLVGPDSSMITGQTIVIDGGFSKIGVPVLKTDLPAGLKSALEELPRPGEHSDDAVTSERAD